LVFSANKRKGFEFIDFPVIVSPGLKMA